MKQKLDKFIYNCDYNSSSLKTKEDEEVWLDTFEAAEFMRLSVGALRNLISDGKIPHYKLGRRNRFLKKELNEILSGQPKGRIIK